MKKKQMKKRYISTGRIFKNYEKRAMALLMAITMLPLAQVQTAYATQNTEQGTMSYAVQENTEESATGDAMEPITTWLSGSLNEEGLIRLSYEELSDIDGIYEIYRDNTLIDTVETSEYIDVAVQGGKTYEYVVRTYNKQGICVGISMPIALSAYEDMVVTGNVTLSEDMQVNSLTINKGASLNLNGYVMTVYGDTQVNGTLNAGGGELVVHGDMKCLGQGVLNMRNANDNICVMGNFEWRVTYGTSSYLTEGKLEIWGDFIQPNTIFAAKNNHEVILSGTSLQTVTMPQGSNFNILTIRNYSSEGVVFTNDMFCNRINRNGCKVTASDGIWGYTLNEDTTYVGDFCLAGDELDLNGYTLHITGNLIQPAGTVNIDGGTLIVDGDYRIQGVSQEKSAGKLVMTNEEDMVLVKGSFITKTTVSHNGLLTNGVLEIQGDMTVGKIGTANAYIATENHTTAFTGEKQQTVTFEASSKDNSRLYNVVFNNTSEEGVQINGTPFIMGNVDDTASVINGVISMTDTTTYTDNEYNGNVKIAVNTNIRKDITIHGNVSNVGEIYINSNFTVDGDFTGYAVVEPVTGRMQVTGDFIMKDRTVLMRNSAGYICIEGDFIHPSSYIPAFNDGTLEIKGNVTINRAFTAGTSHRMLLSGDTYQIISITEDSKLGILELMNTSAEGVYSERTIQKESLIMNESRLTYGDCEGTFGWTLQEDTVIEEDFILLDGELNLNGCILTVNGNFIQPNGTVNVNGGQLIINGDYRIQSQEGGKSYGRLVMQNGADSIQVTGDFVTASNVNHTGLITEGTLQVQGDVRSISTDSAKNFVMSGNSCLILSGEQGQTVTFDSTGITDSRVCSLVMQNTSDEGIIITKGLFVEKNIEQNDTKVTGNILVGKTTTFDSNEYTGDIRIIDHPTWSGDITIHGDVFCDVYMYITGTVHIDGNLKISNHLILRNGKLYVSGNCENTQWGFEMKNKGDYVYIGGDMIYSPTTEYRSTLTEGTLEVAGNITISKGFHASGNHRLLLSGEGLQTIDVDSTQSFGIVEINNYSKDGVLFVQPLNKEQYILNGCRVTYGDGSGMCGYTLQKDTVLEGDTVIIDGEMNLNGYILTVNGNLVQNGGIMNLQGGQLLINGDYSINGNAQLLMTTKEDVVEVEGNFTMASNVNHSGKLSAGKLIVSGDLKADSSISNYNFVTSGSHTVILDGDEKQTLTIKPINDTRTSHLTNLVLDNTSVEGVKLDSYMVVTGDIIDHCKKVTGGITAYTAITFSEGYFGGSVNTVWRYSVLNSVHIGGDLTIFEGTTLKGDVTVDGNLYTRQYLTIEGNQKLIVKGGLCVYDFGLNMRGEEAYVCIYGDITYNKDSRNSYWALPAGTLEVKGNITLTGSSKATGTNRVILSGDKKQTISIPGNFGFNILEIRNYSEEGVYSDKPLINEELILNGCRLTYGDIQGVFGWTLQQDSVIEGNLTLIDGVLDLNGYELTVTGNLTQNSASIRLNGGTLNVGGNLDCNGKLTMSQPQETVNIAGDMNYNSPVDRTGEITAGTIRISGNLNVNVKSYVFRTSNSSVVEFIGEQSSTIVQTNSTEQIHIANLIVNKSGDAKLYVNNRVHITGTVEDISHSSSGAEYIVVNQLSQIQGGYWGGSVISTASEHMSEDIEVGIRLIINPSCSLYMNGHTIDAKYIIVKGNLFVEDGVIRCTSGMDIDTDGRLYMTNEAGSVIAGGYFKMYSRYSHKGNLTAGTLEVKGDFQQGTNTFYATGTHTTIFSGKKTASGRNYVQTITMNWDGVHFANLIVKKPESCYSCDRNLEDMAENFIMDISDCIAPAKVGKIEAVSVAENSVTVRYTAAQDESGIAGYIIYRNGEKAGISYGLLYTDYSLMPDTSYTYTVYAYDMYGNVAENSPAVVVTTTADRTAPEKTTGLMTATRTGSSITIEWNKAEDNVAVAGYNIYRDGKLIASNITKTTYKDTGLSTGIPYTYSVSAVDTSQNEGEKSDAIETYVMPPRIISMTPENNSEMAAGNITIKVLYKNVGNAAGNSVILEIKTDEGWETITTAPLGQKTYNTTTLCSEYVWNMADYVGDGIDSGNNPYFAGGACVIRATLTDADGNTDTCSTTYYIDDKAPQIPDNLKITTENGIIQLTWDKSGSADCEGYRIYRRAADGSYRQIGETDSSNNTQYRDSSVVSGEAYTYTVTAYDRFGHESGNSKEAYIICEPDSRIPVIRNVTPQDTKTADSIIIKVTSEDNVKVAENALYYRVAGEEEWIHIATHHASYGESSFIWDTSILPEGAYEVKAVAWDTSGNESNSTIIRTYTVDHTGIDKIRITDYKATTNSIQIRWEDVTEEDFGYFAVEQLTPEGDYVTVAEVTDTLGYIVTGLEADTQYSFRIVGYDILKNRGEASDVVTVTTDMDHTAPVIQGVYPVSSYYRDSIALSMKVSDNSGVASGTFSVSTDGENYREIYTGYVQGEKQTEIAYDFNIQSYEEGSIYVKFTAEDIAGNHNRLMEDSSEIVVKYYVDRTAPQAVTGFSITSSDGYVGLTWNQPSQEDVSGYRIYKASEEDGIYRFLTETGTLNYYDTTVTEGKTYYYKIAAVDIAGNESVCSNEVCAMVRPDSTKPVVRGISPYSGETVGSNQTYSVLVTDNAALKNVKIYIRGDKDETWTLLRTENADDSSCYVQFTLDTEGFEEGIYHIMVKAQDMAGNESAPFMSQYTLDLTPPAAPSVSAQNGAGKIYVSFEECGEGTAYYELYRKKAGDSSYVKIAVPDTVLYTDRNVELNTVYYYKIRAYDDYGNYSESYPSYGHAIDGDDEAPTAKLPELMFGIENIEIKFDASGSTDNVGIAYYEWDFGDGEAGTGARIIHVYQNAGTYNVTLTVTDAAGNSNTTVTSVVVSEPEGMGQAVITVNDEQGNPLPEAYVHVVMDEEDTDNNLIVRSDANGVAGLVLPTGKYRISVFAQGHLPVEEEITVIQYEKTEETVVLQEGAVVVGELSVHKMTMNELIEAGVDLSNPENYETAVVTVKLGFAKCPIPIVYNYTYSKNSLRRDEEIGFEASSGDGKGKYYGSLYFPSVIGKDEGNGIGVLEYLYVGQSVSWLKDMYEVELGVINMAEPQFTLEDCKAELYPVAGISLAATYDGQSYIQDMGTIAGGEEKKVSWIVKGDKPGLYTLSAGFKGILMPFNAQIDKVFLAETEFAVSGADGLKMYVYPEAAAYIDEPYYVHWTLANEGKKTFYNLETSIGVNTAGGVYDYVTIKNSETGESITVPSSQIKTITQSYASSEDPGVYTYANREIKITTFKPGQRISGMGMYFAGGGDPEEEYYRLVNYIGEATKGLAVEVIPVPSHTSRYKVVNVDLTQSYGDPIDTRTGAYVDSFTALCVAGGSTLSLDLRYNSMYTDVCSAMGYGWYNTYESRIDNANGVLYLYENPYVSSTFVSEEMEAGVVYGRMSGDELILDGNAQYCGRYRCITAGMEESYILKETDGSCILYTPAGEQYAFDTQGRMISITSTGGKEITFTHTENQTIITDDVTGKTMTLTYNSDGLLTLVQDENGRSAAFSYENKRLVGYTDVMGVYTAYTLDETNRITEVHRNGAFVISNSYDEKGRVTAQHNSVSENATTLQYEDGELGTILTITGYDGGVSKVVTDTDHNIISTQDTRGATVTREYDSAGNLIKVTDVYGNVTGYTYEGEYITSMTDTMGNVTAYTYDAVGNVTSISLNGKVAAAYEYNDKNMIIKSQDAAGKVTTYEYDGYCNLIRETVGEYVREYGYENGFLVWETDYNGNKTTYTYDIYGNPATVTDGAGYVTRYTCDAAGNMLSETDADGYTRCYEYDENGNIIRITEPDGTTYSYEYNIEGHLLRTVNNSGQTTTYTNNVIGQPVTIEGSDKTVMHYEYDLMGNITATINAEGDRAEYEYNALNQLIKVTDTLGNVTRYGYLPNGKIKETVYDNAEYELYEYDDRYNLIRVTNQSGAAFCYTYDMAGNITKITDALGNTAVTTWDIYGRATAVTDYNGNTTRYTYDGNGNCIKKTDAAGNTVEMTYDARNLLICVTTSTAENGKLTVAYSYDGRGNLTARTDENGRTIHYTYDSMSRLVTVTDSEGRVTASYTYDASGNVLTQTGADGSMDTYHYDNGGRLLSCIQNAGTAQETTTSYTYDALGRVIQSTDPLEGKSSYTYNSVGNITSVTDPNGGTTKYTYDGVGNITSITDAIGNTDTYTYNAEGLLAEAVNSRNQSTVYSYDLLGRIVSMTDEEGTVTYTYDANGNVLTVTDEKGTIRRTYDSLNRVTTCTDYKGNTIKYGYDELGNIITITYPGGEIIRYSYYPDGSLKSVTDHEGRITSYEYDGNGNLIRTENADGTVETCTYSAEGNLLTQTTANEEGILSRYTYTYDSAGNITEITGTDSGSVSTLSSVKMTYDSANRLVTYNGEDVVYDADGNMTYGPLEGVMTTFVYDCRNRLVQAGDTIYEYDAENVRTATETPGYREEYVTDKNAVLTQVISVTRYEKSGESSQEEEGIITTYVYGKGLISEDSSTRGYLTYHYNNVGSTQYLTDESGEKVCEFAYGTYGELTLGEAGEILFLYNGRLGVMTDENGLYYMRTRYYNPDIKRFINQDVVQGSIANSQSLNKYAYVQGNPVKYTDPFGLCPFMNFRDIGHGVLSLLGMVPGAVGVVADAVNAVWYAVEGNGEKAVECAMSALPGIGDIGAKFLNAKNLVQTAQFVQSISHVVGNAYAFANTFKEASNNAANIYNSLKTGNADWGYVVGQAGAFALNVMTASLAAKDVAENMSTLKNMMSQSVKNVTKLASGQTCEGNGNCFVAGTLIVTSDGTKAIEDIETGDYVLAKNTHTGEQEYREVTNVFIRETDTLILVTLEETIIETTETHPFYTEEGWKCAADLKAGERLELADGTYAEVTAVEVVKLDEAVKVYNFEVGEWHTYYVSEMEVLVHNACNSESGTNTGGNYLYRTIRPDEVIENGLTAKNPNAQYSLTGHVINNSKKGYASQYISTTKDFDNVAKVYADQTGNRVVRIDVDKLPSDVTIFDLSTETNRNSLLNGWRAKSYAEASVEVDIEGFIPAEAIELFYTPK